MNPFQLPRCLLGHHYRDAKKALRDKGGRFTSMCVGCGTPMWRYMDGWSNVRRDPVEVATVPSTDEIYRPVDQ